MYKRQHPDLVVDGHTVSGIPGNQRWGLVQVPVCVHNVLHVAPFVVTGLSLVTQSYPRETGHWGQQGTGQQSLTPSHDWGDSKELGQQSPGTRVSLRPPPALKTISVYTN